MRKNIINISKIFILLFLSLIFMNTYWTFFKSYELKKIPQNPRLREDLSLRGGIVSAAGEYLAKTVFKDDREIRVYPEGEKTSHITGYLDPKLGKSGLEYSYDKVLRSQPFPLTLQGLKERWKEGTPEGRNIYLTLDMELTKTAWEALGDYKGAVVAIKPSTGELLVMVSKPGFEPESINKKWDSYKESAEAPLLNRSLQGKYPPGSIFKVLVLAAALEEGIETSTFNCSGYIEVDGHKFHCPHPHGSQDLTQAMANSCNTAFAEIGMKLGREKLLKYFNKFFSSDYNLPLPFTSSKLTEKNIATDTLLAQTSFGQGELSLTVLEACLMTSSIANKGTIMCPYLIKEIRDKNNRLIEKTEPSILSNPISLETAEKVTSIMKSTVENGTGYRAIIENISVAGKTGTAEQPGDKSHAWFVGFAPAENPEIAVAVIIEEGGSGGEVAAPVAREIIQKAMRDDNDTYK